MALECARQKLPIGALWAIFNLQIMKILSNCDDQPDNAQWYR